MLHFAAVLDQTSGCFMLPQECFNMAHKIEPINRLSGLSFLFSRRARISA
jgi:hypothetical protein